MSDERGSLLDLRAQFQLPDLPRGAPELVRALSVLPRGPRPPSRASRLPLLWEPGMDFELTRVVCLFSLIINPLLLRNKYRVVKLNFTLESMKDFFYF